MIRQTKIALALAVIEFRAMIKFHGKTDTCIRAIILITPILFASLASMALHIYVLKNIFQNDLSLIILTNAIPTLALTNVCRKYYQNFNQKFPKKTFNQTTIELLVWKSTFLLSLSLLYGGIFTFLTYSSELYLFSTVVFCLMTTILLILMDVLKTVIRMLKNHNIKLFKSSHKINQSIIWYKYFLSFRLQSSNGQSGLLMSVILFGSAIYYIEESFLLSLFLFSLSVSFLFFDLVTEETLNHRILIYSNTSALSFFFNCYKLVIIVYTIVTSISFATSFFGYGSTLIYVVIPFAFALYTLYDSIASLSVSGGGFKKIMRRIILPIGIGVILFFNPIVGVVLFAGTTVWLFTGFDKRWRKIRNVY